jgi:hypothetical protein
MTPACFWVFPVELFAETTSDSSGVFTLHLTKRRITSFMMRKHGMLVVLFASFVVSALAADKEGYGSQLGTVVGFGGAGLTYSSGMTGVHPGFGGGFEIGLHRYLGVFGEGGYNRMLNEKVTGCYLASCLSVNAKASLVHAAGGIEVIGSNHSRVVPFGKFGMGYGHASGSVMGFGASNGAPAIAFGGGVRAYINTHFGFQAQVLGLHYVGNHGGGTTGVSTFGVFAQSK